MTYNTLSSKGATFMRMHEGFVAKWYLDPVGVPTIGIGFTWRSRAFREWWAKNKPGVAFARGATMTRAEAEDALRYLVDNQYGRAVNRFLGKTVPQHVYDGTVSPVYNLGEGSLEWKWAAAVRRGDYDAAAKHLRRTGTTASGRTLPGLVRRRKEEALLISKGVYTGIHPSGVTDVLPVVSDAMSDGILKRGERGPDVAKLIRDLSALGHYDGVLDDVFGWGTQRAVLDFQEAHSLVRDGVAGPVTLKAINDAISKDDDDTGGPSGLAWLLKPFTFTKGGFKWA
jgi:GH24 family phage-related lysozyme (muramidase)